MEDQALNNAVRAWYNFRAIPAQVSLKESLTTSETGVNAGVAPNIALRAIAITGISLGSTNSLTQNWSSTPTTGYVDVRRLQMLYEYAVRGDRLSGRTDIPLDELERNLNSIGTRLKDPNFLSKTLGPLPPGPFIEVNSPNQCRGGIDHIASYAFDRTCFRPKWITFPDGKSRLLYPEEIKTLFVLWSYTIPQLSQAEGDSGPLQGASPSRSTLLSVPPPSARVPAPF